MKIMQQELPAKKEMYTAFVNRNVDYEDQFIVGVKTTGIFCRSTCPAHKPKMEHVEFFKGAKQALDAGFRPCKRCRPLQPKGQTPEFVKVALDEVEKDSTRRWTDAELEESGVDPSQLRRWFKKHHDITFHGYLRLRRLGDTLGQIKHDQDSAGNTYDYEDELVSKFQNAMENLINQPVQESKDTAAIYLNRISTPLGYMLAGTTDEGLCLLEFIDRRMLETQLKRLAKYLSGSFVPGSNVITEKVSTQLKCYFEGDLKEFSVPLILQGTGFQQKVWQQLQTIPYARTRSYQKQAEEMGKPKAVRAVARANGDNRIAIIIPCHRVVGKDGKLTGYGGGLWRKRYLLNLEQMNYTHEG